MKRILSSALRLFPALLLPALPLPAAATPAGESAPGEAAHLAPARDGFSAERLDRVRAVLNGWVDRGEFAGANFLVARHGRPVLAESLGFQDLESGRRMQPDTIFRIASMSKPVTAVAAMILYERGKFLLDDPVAKYLPSFAELTVLAGDEGAPDRTVKATAPMTVMQLLTHTSGLANNKEYQAARVFGQGTLADMAAALPRIPLSHQPGAAWRYGASFDVLARLVEVWSGQPYDRFLAEELFRPLGMKDTGFNVPPENVERVAKTYALDANGKIELAADQAAPRRQTAYFSGGGGLYSTAADYLRFCQMLLNGGTLDGNRVLGPVTVEFMLRNQVPVELLPPGGPNGRKGYGHGLGAAVLLDGARSQTLGAEGEYNWGGTYGTFFWIDRKNGIVAVWMTQRDPADIATQRRLKVLTYQALER